MARFKQLKIEIFRHATKGPGRARRDVWGFRFVCPENGQTIATCGEGLVKNHCIEMASKWANTLRAGGCKVVGLAAIETGAEPTAETGDAQDAEDAAGQGETLADFTDE